MSPCVYVDFTSLLLRFFFIIISTNGLIMDLLKKGAERDALWLAKKLKKQLSRLKMTMKL